MDPVIMKFFLENDDDKEFESLLDNTLMSKSLVFSKSDDVIDDYLHNACIDIAVDISSLKMQEPIEKDLGFIADVELLDSDNENDENYIEGLIQSRKYSRPCPFKDSSTQRKRYKKMKIEFSKIEDNDEDYIDSDIEDEDIQKFLRTNKSCKLTKSSNELKEKLERRIVNPFEDKSDEEFFSHLRVTRATFQEILVKLRESNLFYESYSGGNVPVQPEQALQMFLYYMGQKSTYKMLSRIYSLSESAIMTSVLKCIEGLSRLDDVEIKWPLKQDELHEIEQGFQDKAGLTGVIGSVGSACMEMRTNKEPPAGYKIGKLRSIMYLLAVTDANMRFTYIQAGFPGTFSLQEAFESSSMGELIKTSSESLFLNESHYLIGPRELTLHKHLMVPYDNNAGLTDTQVNFNTRLFSSATADTALNLLRSRFATFQSQVYGNLEKIPNIIKACCIVHNMALKDPDDQSFLSKYVLNQTKNYSEFRDESDFIPSPPDEKAILRREEIANILKQ